jgi:hypothetical protein
MFAVVVLAVVASTALGISPPPPPPPSSGPGGVTVTPSPGTSSPGPTSRPPVDPRVVELLGQLNERLAASADALEVERVRINLRVDEVQNLIRKVNTDVGAAVQFVAGLGGQLGRDQPGGQMATLYGLIETTASQTLDASLNNDQEYRRGAAELIGLIGQLPVLQAKLDVLAEPPPTATPTPSGATTPSAAPSPTPSPRPSATAAPTSAPSGSAAPPASPPTTAAGEQIENGGFEAGVGQPWGLYLGGGASATIASDASAPAVGKRSARVDIATNSLASSGITLRQPGLSLEAGRLYTIELSLRSAVEQDVRLRIASSAGAQYYGRIVSLTPTWSTVVYTFQASLTDANGYFEVQLGQATGTIWIDGASFAPIGG